MNTSRTLVRRATTNDVRQIEAIATACGLSNWTGNDYISEIDREDSVFYVASSENEIICGFVVGRIIPGVSDEIKSSEIYNIGVDPVKQRKGLGRSLLDAFISESLTRNASEIHLEVRSGNRSAIEFYRKLGFATIGSRKSFYSNPIEDATLMISIL
jgi:ribosomal-protein-alanine N-acetyltransferase